MNILQTNSFNDFIDRIETSYVSGPESLLIGISDNTNLLLNKNHIYNNTNLDLQIRNIEYLGGKFLNFSGDLNLALTIYGKSDFGIESLELINTYLQSQNINSSISGNDLIIGQTKVASYTKRAHLNGWYQNIVHFSINTDVELVQSICASTSGKIPGRLADYDINANILLEQFQDMFAQLKLRGEPT